MSSTWGADPGGRGVAANDHKVASNASALVYITLTVVLCLCACCCLALVAVTYSLDEEHDENP